MGQSQQATLGQQPARLTTSAFAAAAGITPRKARQLIRAGYVEVIKLPGSRQMVPATEVDRLLAAATRPAVASPTEPAESATGNA